VQNYRIIFVLVKIVKVEIRIEKPGIGQVTLQSLSGRRHIFENEELDFAGWKYLGGRTPS